MKHAFKTAALSACAFFVVTAAPAYAGPGFSGGGWEPGEHLMQLVRKANLTSQQKTQMRDIMMSAKAQEKQLRTQNATLHQQLADKLLGASTPTLADFNALTQQMNAVHAQQVTLGLQTAIQIRALLTSAQVSHIAQIHQQLSNLDAQRSAVLHEDDATDMPTEVEGR